MFGVGSVPHATDVAELGHNDEMAPDEKTTVRPLSFDRHELDEAGAVAARAFHHDPFFNHLAPNPRQRATALAIYWRAYLSSMRSGCHCLAATRDGRMVGVAAWAPPGTFPFSARAQAVQIAGAARAAGRRPRALPGAARTILSMEHAHPKELAHWYLVLLVADPSVQRSGVGSMLVGEVLERCDSEGLPAYLETSNFDNLAYYARHRFALRDKLEPVRAGPAIWTMLREPARS